MKTIFLSEWKLEGELLFGKDYKKWKFRCPCCDAVASVEDFLEANTDGNKTMTQCIKTINKQNHNGSFCSCRADSLLGTMGKGIIILFPSGKRKEVFPFAEPNEDDKLRVEEENKYRDEKETKYFQLQNDLLSLFKNKDNGD